MSDTSSPLTLWIDADGLPGECREVILKAATRLALRCVFVANRPLRLPSIPRLETVTVSAGPDVADQHIAQNAQPGDVAVTSDVPLAAELAQKQVIVITSQGETINAANAGERLATRNLLTELRGQGEIRGGGPPPFDARAKQRFASALDRTLTAAKNQRR